MKTINSLERVKVNIWSVHVTVYEMRDLQNVIIVRLGDIYICTKKILDYKNKESLFMLYMQPIYFRIAINYLKGTFVPPKILIK